MLGILWVLDDRGASGGISMLGTNIDPPTSQDPEDPEVDVEILDPTTDINGTQWQLFDYQSTDVVLHIQHGKTDKHGNFTPLEICLPRGPLAFLLLAHICSGQEVLLDNNDPYRVTPLFLSGGGNPFTDATFSQWWSALLKRSAPELPHFPPSLARTAFVEDYTSKYGVPPDMWDGAAAIMGNSVSTWLKSYNPSHRRRRALDVVAMHGRYVRRRLEQGDTQGATDTHTGNGDSAQDS